MDFPPYSEIPVLLEAARTRELPRLSVSVLRNIVLEPIEPYLRYLAFDLGFDANVQFGQYDHVYQEAIGHDAQLLNREVDCVLVFLCLEQLSPKLASQFVGLPETDLRAELERIHAFVEDVVSGIRAQTDAMILWYGFELPLYPALGVWDGQTEMGQSQIIDDLNHFLCKALRSVPNCYCVDMNRCVARVGGAEFYDGRYWHMSKAPYSRAAMQEIAREAYRFIRPLKGRNKKCLVLDCDDTLWGGVVGEEGLAGIQLSRTYPGSVYYAFQQELVNLHHRGILLALCSKNNEADVWEVFEKHPDMVLRKDHIAAAQIAWQDKVTGLRQIAADLNIGLDSMVFVDDSEFETNLIRQALPEVHVIHLPRAKAVDAPGILAACGLFDTLTVSSEDRDRTRMYRAEAMRKRLKERAPDLEDYLRSLEMVLEIRLASPLTVPRIAQLTQKTNQFNLTTKRYAESSIAALAQDGSADVLTLRLSDRLGDSGIVGVCIVLYQGRTATIDTLLLSCRVLGRRVEDAFIRQILVRARSRSCDVVLGTYVRTAKNAQVESFYPTHGFAEGPAVEDLARCTFRYDLRRGIPDAVSCFKEIRSDMEARREDER